MPASFERRNRRQQERDRIKMINKIHHETQKKFKGMTDEQIMIELQKYGNINIPNQETISGLEILDGQ